MEGFSFFLSLFSWVNNGSLEPNPHAWQKYEKGWDGIAVRREQLDVYVIDEIWKMKYVFATEAPIVNVPFWANYLILNKNVIEFESPVFLTNLQ